MKITFSNPNFGAICCSLILNWLELFCHSWVKIVFVPYIIRRPALQNRKMLHPAVLDYTLKPKIFWKCLKMSIPFQVWIFSSLLFQTLMKIIHGTYSRNTNLNFNYLFDHLKQLSKIEPNILRCIILSNHFYLPNVRSKLAWSTQQVSSIHL